MCEDNKCWNQQKINSLFLQPIFNLIINTPILQIEQDRILWTSSTTGKFFIKSTYRLLIQDRD